MRKACRAKEAMGMRQTNGGKGGMVRGMLEAGAERCRGAGFQQ